jgi:hypothetical protein
MPEVIIGLPGGNKYRNLALLVHGVSKIETINYAHEGIATIDKKMCLIV